MHQADESLLVFLWREVWDVAGDGILSELRRDRVIGPRVRTLIDRAVAVLEHQIAVGLREGRFYAMRDDRRYRGMRDLPVRVTWENRGRGPDVIVDLAIDCPPLHRGPWFIRQPMHVDFLRDRRADHELWDELTNSRTSYTGAGRDQAAALAYAMAHMSEFQQKPTLAEHQDPMLGIHRTVEPPKKCKQCKREYPVDFSIEGRGTGFCRTCYDASIAPMHAVMRLIDICKAIANAVALRWAAALSTHSPAILRTDRTRLYAVCPQHGAALAYSRSLDMPTRFEYHCGPCHFRRETLEQSVAIVRRMMLLAAHVLWEYVTDDVTKRYLMIELGEAPAYVAPRDVPAPIASAVLDEAPIRTLLLEMD